MPLEKEIIDSRREKCQFIASDVQFGKDVVIGVCVNLYGCCIGDSSHIGPFVEIQRGARVGAHCKISSHSFICDGVIIEDGVFVGHGVVFINDNHPRATTVDGALEKAEDWVDRMCHTLIKSRASIGSNATILGGVTIGEGAVIGAGAVVTKDVPAGATVIGNPNRQLQKNDENKVSSIDSA